MEINGMEMDIILKNKKVYELINGKGFVREFNNYGRRIFKGDYLNGKRNGKGKEIKYGKLIFEGEYKDGKEWNGILRLYTKIESNELKVVEISKGRKNGLPNVKGNEYDFNGKLEFEGEYLNGEKNGKCKEYYRNGKLKFEGEYLNGQKNGKEYNNYGK